MKFVCLLVVLSCALWEAQGYPYYSHPYYSQRVARGSMYRQPQAAPVQYQPRHYYVPDRRTSRQTLEETNFNVPPQQNEVFYPQQPENQAFVPNEATKLAEPTEKAAEVAPTTVKAVVVPEAVEPEIEEVPQEDPVPEPKKTVGRKQVKRPVEDDDEDESYAPKIPTGAYFPMFFGWGGRSGGGSSGPTAIANAFSTGRGAASTSHATAYGAPRPEARV